MKVKSWIAAGVAGIFAFQTFALPIEEQRAQMQDNDEEISFVGWPKDSIYHFTDSVLKETEMENDEEEEDDTLLNNFVRIPMQDDSVAHWFDSLAMKMIKRDSTIAAKIAFQHWFDSLSKKEQRKWTMENVTLPRKMHIADSILHRKDSIQAYKDSVLEATPRILETKYLPDSLYYKRLVKMSREMNFGDIKIEKYDSSYNYHYDDFPFFHKDINATWLGVAGSPTQQFNVYTRTQEENAIYYTPYSSWSHTPSDLPMYNTKTPYTELGYSGTLLAGQTKEELNVKFLTTQNITPEANITVDLDKWGGAGQLQNENTDALNLAISTSYLGKKYAIHAGWIHHKIVRTESGGITDPMWIRDTTVKAKEIAVNLQSASSTTLKNTIFLNQSLRIPFGNDSLTTAFVGHTMDLTFYNRKYADAISDATGKTFYNNVFNINPSKSADTLSTTKFDNKIFLRLQPWKDDAIVSKIDAGIGDKLLTYYDYYMDKTESGTTYSSGKTVENNIYAYAGVRGMFRKYFKWNADTHIYFAGRQAGDFDVEAHLLFNTYPFRKDRKSPLSVGADFHTDLTSPDHYENRILLNHYSWDQDFKRKSTTKIGGYLDIPYTMTRLEVGYSLLGNALYYDSKAVIRQSENPVNVISASLRQNFVAWKFHFDNKILFQATSDASVVPVPMLSLNCRWYFEFDVVKQVMKMQIGAQCLYNTLWNLPAYNPELGVFFNQDKYSYGNCPYIDIFLNVQWKRCCIFIKGENINQGWPMAKTDYLTADGYIHTQRTVKFGIWWPFYIQPLHTHTHSHSSSHGSSSHASGLKTAGQ